LPQPLSCGIYRVLDALHVGAIASIDVQSPVCFERPVYLVFDLNVRHMLAARESPDFLQSDSFKVVSGDEFFGHGTAPNSVAIQTKNQADRSCVGSRTETGIHRSAI
jgi:hypothetical protein